MPQTNSAAAGSRNAEGEPDREAADCPGFSIPYAHARIRQSEDMYDRLVSRRLFRALPDHSVASRDQARRRWAVESERTGLTKVQANIPTVGKLGRASSTLHTGRSYLRPRCLSRTAAHHNQAAALLGCVTDRCMMTKYPEFLAVGRQTGSGPTESMCKATTLRIKRVGLRWEAENQEPHSRHAESPRSQTAPRDPRDEAEPPGLTSRSGAVDKVVGNQEAAMPSKARRDRPG